LVGLLWRVEAKRPLRSAPGHANALIIARRLGPEIAGRADLPIRSSSADPMSSPLSLRPVVAVCSSPGTSMCSSVPKRKMKTCRPRSSLKVTHDLAAIIDAERLSDRDPSCSEVKAGGSRRQLVFLQRAANLPGQADRNISASQY